MTDINPFIIFGIIEEQLNKTTIDEIETIYAKLLKINNPNKGGNVTSYNKVMEAYTMLINHIKKIKLINLNNVDLKKGFLEDMENSEIKRMMSHNNKEADIKKLLPEYNIIEDDIRVKRTYNDLIKDLDYIDKEIVNKKKQLFKADFDNALFQKYYEETVLSEKDNSTETIELVPHNDTYTNFKTLSDEEIKCHYSDIFNKV